MWWVCKACIHLLFTPTPHLCCTRQQCLSALCSCVHSVRLSLCLWLPVWLLWNDLAVPEHLPYSVTLLAASLWCCIYSTQTLCVLRPVMLACFHRAIPSVIGASEKTHSDGEADRVTSCHRTSFICLSYDGYISLILPDMWKLWQRVKMWDHASCTEFCIDVSSARLSETSEQRLSWISMYTYQWAVECHENILIQLTLHGWVPWFFFCWIYYRINFH